MKPLVSIIIPTYNRANLIGETLDSVLNQTYPNWECIIVDDRSTDETSHIVKNYSKKEDRFIYVVKQLDLKQGASISRNIGLKIAKGQYVQFLDSDDILAKNKIEEQVKLLINESKYTISTCKWEKFNKISEVTTINDNKSEYVNFNSVKDYFDLIGLQGGFFPSHSFLMNKDLINLSGYWNESLTINDDGEFFFRLLINSDKIIFLDNTHVFYRNNSNDNLSVLNTKMKAISLFNSWRIIEALYIAKYNEDCSPYLNKKKESIYYELKRQYPKIVSQNKFFFKQQIKNDTLFLKFKKLKKRIGNRLKIILNRTLNFYLHKQ